MTKKKAQLPGREVGRFEVELTSIAPSDFYLTSRPSSFKGGL